MWREVLRILNEATVNGLLKSSTPTLRDNFLAALRHSNEVFATFKVHTMSAQMAARLHRPDGSPKSFREWADDVKGIASHQVGAWLQTEYDTAIIRAHNAADWQQFVQDADVMPNLRWMPTTSPTPESSHRDFWERKLTLPVTDPFWDVHHPGDRWNCKCSLEQTDEPATPELKKVFDADSSQPGLTNNPGKDGHTFSQDHPYFPKSCSACPFNKGLKNKLATAFKNEKKHCYECEKVNATFPYKELDERRKEYLAYRSSSSYKNVLFDETSMGLKATHIGHNLDKRKGWYETTAQNVGYRNGHKVILEKEDHTILNHKNTEGTWDDMRFEIAGAETATANNIRQALKHCVSKPDAEVAVIFFPNDNFSREAFENGFAKFKGLKGTSQYRQFKCIYCINKEKIVLTKKPE